MPYLSGYKNDVFISYSLVNDEEELDEQPWVREFHNKLTTRLKNRLSADGKEVQIYYASRDLKDGQQIDVCLEEARQSAVFLAIGSPRYVFDPWPKRELDAFSKVPSSRDRIFIAEFLPLPEKTSYPDTIANTKRAEFWARTETGTPLQYSRTQGAFDNHLADLAQAIVKRLDELATRRPAEAARPRSALPTKTVLLAQVIDSLDEAAYGVRSYLEQFDVRVLPDHSFPQGGPEFAAAFGDCLKKADIFVQLLESYRGRRPSDLAEGYTVFQAEQALARSGLEVLQWRPRELVTATITDPDYRQLVEGPKVVVTGLEQFKEMILARAQIEPEPPPSSKSFIFINADQIDDAEAKAVFRACVARKRFAVLPTYEGGYAAIRKRRSASFRESEEVVLIYVNSEPEWLTSQVLLYNKYVAPAKSKPRVRLIFRAFPKTEDELPVFHPDFEVVDAHDGDLAPLFKRLFQ